MERSNFGDLLEPGLRKIYDDVYQNIPQMYASIFNVGTSDKESEKDSAVTGFGLLNNVAEKGDFPEVDIFQGFSKVYTHVKFGGIFTVSKELHDDDLYNVINKKPKSLAEAVANTTEYQAATVFHNAFSTSHLGGNGKPLCSVSQKREDGGSAQSNASSTGIPFTEENLEIGRLALRQQRNARGLPMISGQKPFVLVPPAREKEAVIVTQSDKRAETADNDLNLYKGTIANVMVWDWLSADVGGSDDAWFLIDPGLHQLNFFWRKKAEFEQDTLLSNEVSRFKASMRFSFGFSDWRGVWGSKGDGQAYSN